MSSEDRHLTRTLRRALADPLGVGQEDIARALFQGGDPGASRSEERSSGRMGVRLQAALRTPDPWAGRIHAVVTDVGLSGLCAEVEENLPEPGPVALEMSLPAPGGSCFMRGRVSWVSRDSCPARVGLELDDDCAWSWFATLKRIVDAVRFAAEPKSKRSPSPV